MRSEGRQPGRRIFAKEVLTEGVQPDWRSAEWAPSEGLLQKARDILINQESGISEHVRIEGCAAYAILFPDAIDEMRAAAGPAPADALRRTKEIVTKEQAEVSEKGEFEEYLTTINYEWMRDVLELFPELAGEYQKDQQLMDDIRRKLVHNRQLLNQSFMHVFIYIDLVDRAMRLSKEAFADELAAFPSDEELLAIFKKHEAAGEYGEEFGHLYRNMVLSHPEHTATLEWLRPQALDWEIGSMAWLEEDRDGTGVSENDASQVFRHIVNARIAAGETVRSDGYGRLYFPDQKTAKNAALPPRNPV